MAAAIARSVGTLGAIKITTAIVAKTSSTELWINPQLGGKPFGAELFGFIGNQLILGLDRFKLGLRTPLLAAGKQREQSGQHDRCRSKVLQQLGGQRSKGRSAAHLQPFSAHRLTTQAGIMVSNELTAAGAKGALRRPSFLLPRRA